jgi:site-specific DNA-adenine methylase
MMWRGFDALVPYFGGKRKLCPRIFREISRALPQERWATARLVDPFLGGGAVGLYAKGRGFAVQCSDIAERSALIGRALIANESVKIEHEDVARLFVPQDDAGDHMQTHAAPDNMTPLTARFLDNAWTAAARFADARKRDLARLLLVKYLFWLRPHSKFSSPNAFNRPFAEGRFDDIKATYKQAIGNNAVHPSVALDRLRGMINAGIFRGAQMCRAWQGDAREAVAMAPGADVLYLDPPYAGTLSYEAEYSLLDHWLGDALEPSPYSADRGLAEFGAFLGACQSHRLWVISYGNAVASLEQVRAVIEQYRPTHAVELAYAHLGAVATAEKSARNREFIILAGEGVEA